MNDSIYLFNINWWWREWVNIFIKIIWILGNGKRGKKWVNIV